MTDHQELMDAAPFVLDALDDLERARFERHLDGCAECQVEVDELRAALDGIAEGEAVEPPPAVKAAVLDALDTTPQDAPITDVSPDTPAPEAGEPRRWMVPVAALVAIVVAIAAISLRSSDPSIDDLLAAADTRVIEVAATEAYDGVARAEAVVSGDASVVYLSVDGLEPAGQGMTYEAWIIEPSGPVPAGLFTPSDDGTAVLLLDGSVNAGSLIGVTIEPAGGSDQPTGDVLFLAEV